MTCQITYISDILATLLCVYILDGAEFPLAVTMEGSVAKDAISKRIIRIDPSKLDSTVQNSLKNALAKLKGELRQRIP